MMMDLRNLKIEDVAAMAGITPLTHPPRETYRGWTIYPHEWLGWAAYGPNYDASYEGPEDGWVDNGENADARTREALIAEIDAWFEEHS